MIDRALVPPAITTGGAAIALVGTFLPWIKSGAVDRSSYEIFDLVERLGFSANGVIAWALRLWPLVPLLLVVAAVATWLRPSDRHLRRWLALVPAVSAVIVAGTAIAVRMAPKLGLFRVGIGPWVTLVGAVIMLVGGVWLAGGAPRSTGTASE